MVTLDWLYEEFIKASDEFDIQKATTGRGGGDAWRRKYELEHAIRWMEESKLTEVPQLGKWGSKDIKRGQEVTIRKGAVILSMNPRHTRENPKIAKRSYKVKIHSVMDGYLYADWHSHDRGHANRPQQISWPGEGGYWCYLNTSEVEVA
jgi:hypothetical protein